MKKIFRMALVFALAGATLMYTGCTKDYDEDINAANQKIESIVAQHAADVAALKNDLSTAVSNLEAAYKKADDAVTAAYKAADADLQKAIDANKTAIDANKAAIDANKAAIADANTAIAAIEEELKTFATKEELAAAEAGLEAKIKAVADDLADVKAKLDKVAEDLGKQISDLDAKFTTALAEQKADLEGQIAKALEAAKTDLGSAKAELEAALALLGNELRMIVADPDLYYAGVEAFNYTWTNIRPLDMYLATGDHEFKGENRENVTFKKDAEIYAVPAAKLLPYTFSQLATANYSLNPSSFDVNKAEWALSGQDYEFLVRADAPKVWAPEFVKWDNGAVRYTIANPELLPTTVYAPKDGKPSTFDGLTNNTKSQVEALLTGAGLQPMKYQWITIADILNWLHGGETQPQINEKFWENLEIITKDIASLKEDLGVAQADIETLKAKVDNLYQIWAGQQLQIANLYFLSSLNYKGVGYIPTMRLSATLAENKEVVSDYAAIVSDPEFFAALAFNSKSEYKANAFCKAGSHLYLSAPEAVQNAASVPVAYDKTLDLNFVNIHMFDAYKGEYETTLAELKKVYPSLELKYSLVDYYDGDNKTEESMYGRIDANDVFHPMCVIGGKQTEPKDAPNGGISSVGRKPVVLVKLINNVETEDGVREDVVLAGYFKIEIVKDISTDTIDFPAFDIIPFYCDTQKLSTSWDQFSDLVVEYLGTTYKQFVRDYKLDSKENGEKSDILQGNPDRAVVYELDENNNYVDTYDATKGDYKYANIYYFADGYGDGVNDIFEVFVTYDQLKAIGAGNSKTLYIKFSEDLYNVVYISFTIKVAETAKFDFGANKLNNEWFKMIEPEALNTVLMNVAVPAVAGDKISNYKYSRDLDHYFVGYEPSKVLTADSPEVYKSEDLYDEEGNPVRAFAPHYEYLFNAEQSCKAFDFVVNEDGDELYLEEIDEAGDNLIAYIKGTTLFYAETDAAKEVLNAFAHDAKIDTEMVWADIHVKVTYGNCKIDAGSADFHVRFLRPLNINFLKQEIKEESQVNGANLRLANFLGSIIDWNNQEVVYLDNKNVLQEKVIKNQVNMYQFYGFTYMWINLNKAERNNWNTADPSEFGIMMEKTPSAKLTFGTADDKDYFTPITDTPYGYYGFGLSTLNSLKNFVINYKNDNANVEAFQIKIPVTVDYYWGSISEMILVDVQKTTETQPGK